MAPVFAGLRGRGHGQEADLPQMLHWYGLDIQGVGWGGGLVIVFCMGGSLKFPVEYLLSVQYAYPITTLE